MNIADAHTKTIWNNILSLKSTFSSSQQEHPQLTNKSNSIEITKISMTYPINKTDSFDLQQPQHQMVTRKRTQNINDTDSKNKRRR